MKPARNRSRRAAVRMLVLVALVVIPGLLLPRSAPPALADTGGAVFVNASFESPQFGGFSYSVAGAGWAFTNNAGIQHNGSAYSGSSPLAPDGTQTAFVQGVGGTLGTMSQSVIFAAGIYSFGFQAARRYGTIQPIQVSVDSTVVGTYTPAGGSFALITTGTVTVAAGAHTVRFAATDSSADKTSFVDAVSIIGVTSPTTTATPTTATPTTATPTTATATTTTTATPTTTAATTTGTGGAVFANAGFEAPQFGGYSYSVAGSGWTFANNAGIQHNGSAYSGSSPLAPDGTQTAFVQGVGGTLGTMSQSVIFAAGTYSFGFQAARRYGTVQPIQVSVDSTVVGTYTPAGGSFALITTGTVTVAAGAHTVRFAANDSSADKTSFIDAVTVNGPGTPTATATPITPATSTTTATPTPTTPAVSGQDIDLIGYGLAFADEFNALSVTGSSPKSSSTWYDYPPYGPAGNYSASTWDIGALSTGNGILSDRAYLGSSPGTAGNYWNSGNLSSVDTTGAGFSQRYGYFEARIQMPNSGTGAWPAFWLASTTGIAAVSPTRVPIEEIDIAEWYGVTTTPGSLQAVMQQASHNYAADGTENPGGTPYLYAPQTPMPGGAYPWQGFHNYGVRVDAAHITWYIDGVQTNQIATPSQYMTSPLYLMLDYGLGGGWPLSGMVNGSAMLVDWVRAYTLPGQ